MRKKSGVLKRLGKECQRKATMSATKAVYEAVWRESPRKKYRGRG